MSEQDVDGIAMDDFIAFRPAHNFIFLPTREPWPGASVNAQLPPVALLDANGEPVIDERTGKVKMITASAWLDMHRPAHQMTWAPGKAMLVRDRVVADGGWIDKPGAVCLNLYRPPIAGRGNAKKAKPWIDHIKKVYPNDWLHIIRWLAHRTQRPWEKLNHCLMLGGAQGVGKDSLLEPVKHAVGPWNFIEVSPTQMLGRFNGFTKSVILRVSEARDLGESNRFSAYDAMKTYAAAPPDVLRVDEKNLREHYVMNVTGLIVTTNYLTDGAYLPADDRRHFVAWSELTKDDFTPAYWAKLWTWYNNGGIGDVVAYLNAFDLGDFDAKAPPRKTEAFWSIANANRAPEESELADIIERLGEPAALTIDTVARNASSDFRGWLEDRKNRRSLPHRFESVGFTPVRNPNVDGGLWRLDKIRVGNVDGCRTVTIESERQVIYARKTLPLRDQIAAVEALRRAATAKAKARVDADKAEKAKAKKVLIANRRGEAWQ